MIHLIMAFMKAVYLNPTPFVINWTFIRNQHDIFEKLFFRCNKINIRIALINIFYFKNKWHLNTYTCVCVCVSICIYLYVYSYQMNQNI